MGRTKWLALLCCRAISNRLPESLVFSALPFVAGALASSCAPPRVTEVVIGPLLTGFFGRATYPSIRLRRADSTVPAPPLKPSAVIQPSPFMTAASSKDDSLYVAEVFPSAVPTVYRKTPENEL